MFCAVQFIGFVDDDQELEHRAALIEQIQQWEEHLDELAIVNERHRKKAIHWRASKYEIHVVKTIPRDYTIKHV